MDSRVRCGSVRPEWAPDRRAFLKSTAAATLAAFLAPGGLFAAPGQGAARPNIVLIFADDLGWKDVSYQGSSLCETPNIDRLSQQGVVFTDAYAPAANCAPSRACLLSGNYTPRHHVFAVGSTDRGHKESMRLIPIPNKSGLAKSNMTMADALKAAGYATGIFGKWHLDGPEGAPPSEQGFDVVSESFHGWGDKGDAQQDNPKGIFSLTRAAGEFMESNVKNGRPFFAYVSHYAIHTRHQARPDTLARFEAKGLDSKQALYAACTWDLDAGVGLLLKKIDELGIADNTLVVFTSDNGALQQSSQEPLRGSKGGYYEGGIREPFIVRWPGVTKPRTTCAVPVSSIDLFPTFLAAAGAPAPADKPLDGEDLTPLLRGGQALQRSALFWHFPGYLNNPVVRGRPEDVRLGFRTRPISVIRKGDWKLHLFHEEWVLDGGREKINTNHAVELYNLRDDMGEHHDLSLKETARRDELLDDLLAWLKSIHAPIPFEKNPAYRPAAAR